jgi:hypothetical protein
MEELSEDENEQAASDTMKKSKEYLGQLTAKNQKLQKFRDQFKTEADVNKRKQLQKHMEALASELADVCHCKYVEDDTGIGDQMILSVVNKTIQCVQDYIYDLETQRDELKDIIGEYKRLPDDASLDVMIEVRHNLSSQKDALDQESLNMLSRKKKKL